MATGTIGWWELDMGMIDIGRIAKFWIGLFFDDV